MTPVRIDRRRALALGLAVPAAALGLVGCGGAPAALEPPAAGEPPAVRDGVGLRLHTDFAARPGGSPLPDRGDEGVPFRVVDRGPGRRPVVERGALLGLLPDRPSAVYVNQQLDGPLRRIGATFSFGPGSGAGALCLAAWTGVPLDVDPAARTPCHLVITPERWIHGVIEGAPVALRVVASGTHARPLRTDGATRYTVEATLSGPTARLHLPDGGVVTVSDPGIRDIPGTVACWEYYKDAAGGADVAFARTWAG